MPEPIPAAVADQATTHLGDLQTLLQAQGLHTRVLTSAGRLPRLRVINPGCASLSEVITAAPVEGEWSFWWSWAEPITPISDAATAAERIGHVLTPAAHPPTDLPPGANRPHGVRPPSHDGDGRGLGDRHHPARQAPPDRSHNPVSRSPPAVGDSCG